MAARLKLELVVSLLALFPACSWWNGISYPIPPTTDNGDETPIAFEHYVQVAWNSTDLSLLESLDVQFPAQVSIVPSADTTSGGDELSVQIHFDVEKPNDDAYTGAYLQQIQAASNLNSQNAQIHVPLPQQPCQQTQNAEGQITAIQGVCVRDLTISVPASHPVPISVTAGGDVSASGLALPSLQLAVADGSHTDIENLNGNLTVSGAGSNATLTVAGLGDVTQKTGNLVLMLNAIKTAQLSTIGGSVYISVTQPPTQSGAVTLDGKAIPSFPFTR